MLTAATVALKVMVIVMPLLITQTSDAKHYGIAAKIREHEEG